MSEHVEKTIAELQAHIVDLEQEANDAKKTVNSLCKRINRPAIYTDIDTPVTLASSTPLQGDEFHSRPQATVVREILENRRSRGLGPATVDELYAVMLQGGFEFTGKTDEIKKRGLSITLAKNSTFYKLPNGKIGIREWYNIKDQKPATNGSTKHDSDELVSEVAEVEPEEAAVPVKPR